MTESGCFFRGSNTSLRHHIRSLHFEAYEAACLAAGIPVHHAAIPLEVIEARRAEAHAAELVAAGKDPKAGTLDGFGWKKKAGVQGPVEFTTEAALEHISKFIVTSDSVSAYLFESLNTYLMILHLATLYRGRCPLPQPVRGLPPCNHQKGAPHSLQSEDLRAQCLC